MKTLIETYADYQLKVNGFAIIKPGFLRRAKDIYKMLAEAGWQLINAKTTIMSLGDAKELYKPHEKKDFYKSLCKYMTSGPIVALSLYKDCKEPVKELEELKDKIRKLWGIDDMKNVLHSSDSDKNMKREHNILFATTAINEVRLNIRNTTVVKAKKKFKDLEIGDTIYECETVKGKDYPFVELT